MGNTSKQVVILDLGNEITNQCTQLLADNGYEVKIKKNTDSRIDISEINNTNVIELGLNLTQAPNKIRSKDNILIQNTCKYLNKNIYHKLVLDDIASLMGSNRSKLAATFKRALGVGVFEWLRKQRMLKAKSLLEHSELSVQEIGFEVGYENSANFSSAYKKEFGISPRQQRNISKVEIVTISKVFPT